jgi:hypothetical protein
MKMFFITNFIGYFFLGIGVLDGNFVFIQTANSNIGDLLQHSSLSLLHGKLKYSTMYGPRYQF